MEGERAVVTGRPVAKRRGPREWRCGRSSWSPGKPVHRAKAHSRLALPVTQVPAYEPWGMHQRDGGEQCPETKCPTGVEPCAVKVACTVLNGEGGETGTGTALCPYPTPTPTASARPSLRLLARLTAGVRCFQDGIPGLPQGTPSVIIVPGG